MKYLNPIKAFATVSFLSLAAFSAKAQLDTCNVFLKGHYVEVGIAQNGGYGSTIDAYPAYVAKPVDGTGGNTFYDPCDTANTCITRTHNVGFMADPDKDGWLSGSPPYYGDYFLPGQPQEGWGVEVGGTECDAYTSALQTCGATGYSSSSMTGSNVSYTNLGRQVSGVWAGEYDLSSTSKLAITQTTTIDTGAVYFIVYVTLKNVGTSVLNNIYYMRTLDPDNDVTLSHDYTTRNVISYKIPNPENKVLVSTWGTHYTRAYCGLGTEDCRAKAFIVTNSLVPSDPINALYNQTGSSARYDSLTADVGVGLAYSLGNLSPGDSTAITYAYILSIDQLDSAFLATRPKWLYSGDSSSLVTGDTASVCKNSTSTVSIVHGGAYNWTWTAYPIGTVITPTTGPTVNVTVGTSPVFVTAVGTSPACFTDTIHMTLNPTRTPPAPPAKITSYCQFAPPTRLTASGINLLWYNAATGGTGSKTAPSPSTTVPGTYYFWVSQTIKGCESDRTQMTVIVNAGNVDTFSYTIRYGCHGDTVKFTNLSTGSIVSSIWDFGDGTTDTVANPTHIFLAQGTYKVKLTTLNNFNCSYNTTQTLVLSHPVKSSFTVTPDTTCEFKPVNFVASSTGLTPLSYLWVYGDGATGTGATSTHFYNNTGVYDAMLITGDFVPCYDTAHKSVTIDTFATADFSTNLSVLCQGQSIIFNGDYSPIGNIGAIWNFGDGSTLRDQKHPSHAFATPGTYVVTLTAKYRQCPDTTVKKTITVHPIPNVYLGPDTSMCPHTSAITLYDHVNAGNGAASWLWNTGETSSSITAGQPGIYYTTVTVDGCSNTDSVDVKNDCYLSVPNAFSPDGDGVNDYFFPRSLLSSGLTGFKMSIFNRWGELIFQTDNLNGRGWDGKFNNVIQPASVYVYVIDITLKNGSVQHYQGNVTLLR